MELINQLKLVGLNHSEIQIYLYLLENGLSTPPRVSRGTKITRTNCYNVLESLQNKDLITEQMVKNKKAYVANDPESLLRSWERKKDIIKQIMPDLRGLYTIQKNKPKVRFYDGVEQLKEVYLQSLNSKKIMAIGSTRQIDQLMPGFLDYYFGEIKNREIIFYDLLSMESKDIARGTKNALRGYYDVQLMPKEYSDPPTDLLLWDGNIALITLKEPVFATVLSNNLLFESFSMIFDLLWKNKDLVRVESEK